MAIRTGTWKRARKGSFPVVAILALAGLTAACDTGSDSPGQVSGLSPQRVMLSEGYSLLYADARVIDLVDLALYVKVESPEFNDVISEISRYGDQLKHDLERVARDYPGVRIDLKPLPEMETRKRSALVRDRMLRFAPSSSRSRQEYERTMLIGLAGVLSHESYMSRVMAEEEPDPGLKTFLRGSEKRYSDLHERVIHLLNREHFTHNANKAQPPDP